MVTPWTSTFCASQQCYKTTATHAALRNPFLGEPEVCDYKGCGLDWGFGLKLTEVAGLGLRDKVEGGGYKVWEGTVFGGLPVAGVLVVTVWNFWKNSERTFLMLSLCLSLSLYLYAIQFKRFPPSFLLLSVYDWDSFFSYSRSLLPSLPLLTVQTILFGSFILYWISLLAVLSLSKPPGSVLYSAVIPSRGSTNPRGYISRK